VRQHDEDESQVLRLIQIDPFTLNGLI